MKLTDVARASLSELRGDYEIFILDRGELPWSMTSEQAIAINAISLDEAMFIRDVVNESAKHAKLQRKKYAQWLDSNDPIVVANAMLIIIGRALNMLKRQITAQIQAFEETGGFQERLTSMRKERRAQLQQTPDAPICSMCGQQMYYRTSARGPFWGCSGFPACRYTRNIEAGSQDSGA